MGAAKRARKIRGAEEFDVARLRGSLQSPRTGSTSIYSWTVEDIMTARDLQSRGLFLLPARLAETMKTDDALAVAWENRLAPQRCIGVKLVPAGKGRAVSIAQEAEALFGQEGVGIHPDSISDIHSCLVDHGVAFGVNVATPRADGSRVDLELKSWPIEFVRWDPYYRVFKTRVDPTTVQPNEIVDPTLGVAAYGVVGGAEVPIVHGDGRWVIFKKHETYPWRAEAAILPAAIVWARHAFATQDWAKGSSAHGNAKIVGEMPPGMPLQADGKLTPEAAAFLALLRDMQDGSSLVGIMPAGAKVDFVTNNSTAWQVWNELCLNAEKAAARIYLGTDGVLGAAGGAPGVDISMLFGVATTKVEGDLKAIERGLLTGVLEPWCALNFGDSALTPRRKYLLPDADEKAQVEAEKAEKAARAEARKSFFVDIKSAKENGFVVDQAYADKVAEVYGLDEAPMLPPPQAASAPTIQLAPTDIARVVSVNEARATVGLASLLLPDGALDPDGRLTVEQYAAKKAAEAAASAAPPPGPPAPPVPPPT